MKYSNHVQKISGKNKGYIFLFTLSTCIWCQKTKKLLKELGVEYSFIDVDLVLDESKAELMADLSKNNPEMSFPTIIISGKEKIIGFDEEKLKELLSDE